MSNPGVTGPNSPVSSYTWTDPSNANTIWPICNSKFLYGVLSPTNNVQTSGGVWYTCSSTQWGSLNVSLNEGNKNLVNLKEFGDNEGITDRYTISARQSGIYRIRVTLIFNPVAGLNSGAYLFFIFSTEQNQGSADSIIPISSTSNPNIAPLTTNQALSLGYTYTYNSSDSANYPASGYTLTGYTPIIALIPTYSTSTSFVQKGLSVIEQIIYLQANIPLYFNIAPATTGDYIDASGNFTMEMLSMVVPTISNTNNNISNSTVMQSNGYSYIEFYNTNTPSNTSSQGTATVSFLTAIPLNYLLVGGGGGGGTGGTGNNAGGGGGGGGGSAIYGQVLGSSFTINVGAGGFGGTFNSSTNTTNTAYNGSYSSIVDIKGTTITTIATASGGNFGSSGVGSSAGGNNSSGGAPVDSSGNGTPLTGTKGGNGFIQNGSNGSNGGTQVPIVLPFNKTYNVGGAGGGGGVSGGSAVKGGQGGQYNTGGNAQGNTNDTGGQGEGYGTGGGGGAPSNQAGGNAKPGLVVLYWQ